MANRPRIHCPHCEAIFHAERLPAKRKYRNMYGIDVFACPECAASIKFEPAEYLFASQQIERGEYDEDTAIGAVLEDDILPSEQAAIDYGKGQRVRGGCLSVIAWIGVGVLCSTYFITDIVIR